jgi:hypothetical protein
VVTKYIIRDFFYFNQSDQSKNKTANNCQWVKSSFSADNFISRVLPYSGSSCSVTITEFN